MAVSNSQLTHCQRFLLAKLHMDSLTKQPHRKALRLTLESLPTELNNTYDEALSRIASQERADIKVAHRVLGWVTHANRPLTLKELQHALSVEPGQNDLDQETLIDEDILISVCLGLVSIDQSSGELRLIHYTAQKYFERRLLGNFPEPHRSIASTCLTYLSFDSCLGFDLFSPASELRALSAKYVLLDYAGPNWGLHACQDEQKLEQQIRGFLDPRAAYLSSRLMIGGWRWLNDMFTHTHWDYPIAYESQVSGHHMAAYFGLKRTITKLFDSHANAVQRKRMLDSALLIATAKGHLALVQYLLDQGGDINVVSWSGYPLLHLAAGGGNVAAVRMLLDFNANVDLRRSHDAPTALHVATTNGHDAVVRILLDRNANVNLLRYHGLPTALHIAVANGNEAVVHMLLDSNANVESQSSDETPPPLHLACRNGREAIVRMLLSRGADANLEFTWLFYPERTTTALKIAVFEGFTTIAKALLENGADVNVQIPRLRHGTVTGRRYSREMSTALCDAIAHKQEAMAALLIEWEADVELGDLTPLETAIAQDDIPLVRLLRQNGAKAVEEAFQDRLISRRCSLPLGTISGLDAEICVPDIPGLALIRAMKLGLDFPVACLVEAGADINFKSVNGDFPFYAAARWGHESNVRELLDNGADSRNIDQEMWCQKAVIVRRRIMTRWDLDPHDIYDLLSYDAKAIRNELLREEQGPYFTDHLAHNLNGGPPPKRLKEYGI